MKDDDESEGITYKLEKTEDDEIYGIFVIDPSRKLTPEKFCEELEYFIEHAREDGFSVFEHLLGDREDLH